MSHYSNKGLLIVYLFILALGLGIVDPFKINGTGWTMLYAIPVIIIGWLIFRKKK